MTNDILPSALLFVIGFLGATDVLLYHSVSHGIRTHPDSKIELIFHALRGPTYAFLFIIIPNFLLCGIWYWILVLILVFDVAISIADFWVEEKSRDFLGGLPSGEYVLHMIIAMIFGAFFLSVVIFYSKYSHLESQIYYLPISWEVSLVFSIMAVLVFYSGLQDALAVFKMWNSPIRRKSG